VDADIATFNDVWILANANANGTPAWTQAPSEIRRRWAHSARAPTFFSAVRDPGANSMIIFGGISIEAAYGSPWVLSHANGL